MSYRYSKTKIDGFIKDIRYKEVELWSAKSSWPWWQHVNKTESKVQLSRNVQQSLILPLIYKEKFLALYPTHITADGALRIDTQVHRSQTDNKELTLKKFAAMIHAAFKPPKPPRRMTEPPKHAVDARIAAKKRRSKIRSSRTIIKR